MSAKGEVRTVRATRPRNADEEQLRWRAEEIVNQSVKNSPSYEAAVQKAMDTLRQAEREVSQIIEEG